VKRASLPAAAPATSLVLVREGSTSPPDRQPVISSGRHDRRKTMSFHGLKSILIHRHHVNVPLTERQYLPIRT
jgi:hypothetical protein